MGISIIETYDSRIAHAEKLVISQTKSFHVDQFTISDESSVPVGAIVQNSHWSDFLMASRSVAVAATDIDGNPTQPVMVIQDPPNFLHDIYEVYLPNNETPLAVIRREFSFFKTKMTVTMQQFSQVEM